MAQKIAQKAPQRSLARPRVKPRAKPNTKPKAERGSQLARELQELATSQITPITARDQAVYTVQLVRSIAERFLADYSLHLVSASERIAAEKRLVENLLIFDWRSRGLDPEVMALALDREVLELLVQRIAHGESLRFLEDLCYERLNAIARLGATREAVSGLRLPNPRRGGPAHTLQSRRALRDLPHDS